jgi:hypothetical protein
LHAKALYKGTTSQKEKESREKRTDKAHTTAFGSICSTNHMNEENIENDFYFYA